MKKFIFFLLTFLMLTVGFTDIAYAAAQENEGAVLQMEESAPLVSNILEETPLVTVEVKRITAEPIPSDRFSADIPLTHEEQDWLQSACEEFKVPYALALGLIEKETTFRNIIADSGASAGYMQVQKRWHSDRMKRLGVTDLMDPYGNFRVGLDYLVELYDKYSDWSMALTVYNRGHNPGYITNYAKDVMKNYERWQELVKNYD